MDQIGKHDNGDGVTRKVRYPELLKGGGAHERKGKGVMDQSKGDVCVWRWGHVGLKPKRTKIFAGIVHKILNSHCVNC